LPACASIASKITEEVNAIATRDHFGLGSTGNIACALGINKDAQQKFEK